MIKPASKQTLHDNILAQMTQAIKSGQWKPGERVPGEQELAQLFQVSRNSIREVLKAFVLSGVMEAHPGQGTFLTGDALVRLRDGSLSTSLWEKATLSDMLEVRLLLEGQTAYQAAQRALDEEIESLGRALEAMRGDNRREVHECFHLAVARMSGNPLLCNLLTSIQNQIQILRARYAELFPTKRIEAFFDEHMLIYEMIRDRKPEEARKAMLGHIEAAWKEVIFSGLERRGA